jgi:hypothetical protein
MWSEASADTLEYVDAGLRIIPEISTAVEPDLNLSLDALLKDFAQHRAVWRRRS